MALWVGLPGTEGWRRAAELARRLPWALFGLLLLRGALGAWRGWPLAEALPLAALTGMWFLLGLAAPAALLRINALLPRNSAADTDTKAMRISAVEAARWGLPAGALVILAGQAAAAPLAVQAGCVLSLAAWAALGWAGLKALRG
jgi:hypothetical protein